MPNSNAPTRARQMVTYYHDKHTTVWCPLHDRETLKRGTNQCRRGRKRGVLCLIRQPRRVGGGMTPAAYRVGIQNGAVHRSPTRLVPMRRPNQSTQRAIERWKKGHAR